jgi:hypothetical protein
MHSETELTPAIEQSYLKRSAMVGTILALYLISTSTYTLIENSFSDATWLKVVFGALVFILCITMTVTLFKDLKIYKKVNHKTFWYGKYTDEYIGHVSMKAYQYSFNVMTILLLLAYLTHYFPEFLNSIGVHEFVKLNLAVLLLSYGLPILYMLRKEQD